MDTAAYIFAFIAILLVLVVLHELGHFVTAKLAKVRVEEFGVGLPPRITGRVFRGTLYSINWLPIGGFVRLTGEESSGILVRSVDPGLIDPEYLRAGDRITHVGGKRVYDRPQFARMYAEALASGIAVLSYGRTEDDGTIKNWSFTRRDPYIESERGAEFTAAPSIVAQFRSAEESGEQAETDAAIERFESVTGIVTGADPHSLGSKSRPTRIAILAAGAAVNAILPVFLFTIGNLIPDNVPNGPVIVTSVISGAPADRAGIEPGDRIVAFDGAPIRNTTDLLRETQTNLGEDVVFTVERPASGGAGSLASVPADVRIAETFEAPVHLRLAPSELRHVVQEGESVAEIADLLGVTAGQVLGAWGVESEELEEGLVIDLPGGDSYVVEDGDTIGAIAAKPWIRTSALYRSLGIDPRHPPPGTEIEIPQGATGIGVRNDLTGATRIGHGFFDSIARSGGQIVDTFLIVRNRIRSWIAGGPGLDFSGPIGIARVTGEVIERAGWARLIELAALLSLNLAIINILPLPMLDGGRIFFIFIEILRRGKRISPEREGLVHLAGLAAFIIFIVVVSYFDIVRAVSGESAIR